MHISIEIRQELLLINIIMKTLILFLLFPILSYSQNIGERIPLNIEKGMLCDEMDNVIIHMSVLKDSTTIIATDKTTENIVSIDYIIPLEKWQRDGLVWATQYKAIGKNVFYDAKTGDYYFVVYTEGKFIIQVRNESKVLSL